MKEKGNKVMKYLFIVFYLFVNICNAQNAQEYLNDCVKDLKAEKVTKVIVKAGLCSACERTDNAFIFIQESDSIYKFRYIKYFDGYESAKIIVDTLIVDNMVEEIFRIEKSHHDSIVKQITNLEELLQDTIIENGIKLIQILPNHGRMRLMGIYSLNTELVSLVPNIISTKFYKKAYYYWLLDSFINDFVLSNYIDIL